MFANSFLFPAKTTAPEFVAQVHISFIPRDTLHRLRSFLDSVRYATPPGSRQRGGDHDLGGARRAHEAEEKTGGQFWFLGWKYARCLHRTIDDCAKIRPRFAVTRVATVTETSEVKFFNGWWWCCT